MQQQHFLEADRHEAAHRQNEQNNDRRHDSWDVDMPYSPQPGRAIDRRRVVQFRVDARERGQVDDRSPAESLPLAGPNENVLEPLGDDQKLDRIAAERLDNVVDQAGLRVQKSDNHSGHDNGGNKMGGIADRLRPLLKCGAPHFVERQGEQHRQWKQQQSVHVEHERIADQIPEVIRIEEALEVIQPGPWTAPDPLGDNVIFEGDLHAVKRNIVKNEKVGGDGKQQSVQLPVPARLSDRQGEFRTSLHDCGITSSVRYGYGCLSKRLVDSDRAFIVSLPSIGRKYVASELTTNGDKPLAGKGRDRLRAYVISDHSPLRSA